MRNKSVLARSFVAAAALIAGTAVALPITATEEVPRLIPYSGHLDQAGAAVNGTRSMQFTIVDGADAPLWTSAERDITFAGGAFTMVLGESPDPAIPDAVFSAAEIYVTVSVEGTALLGRQRLYAQPYAIRATSAYEASAGSPLNTQLNGLQQAVGSGVLIANTGDNMSTPVDIGTARLVGPNGGGDYSWPGATSCDPGRVLTIANMGSGFLTISTNGFGCGAGCFPFRTTSGANIPLNGAVNPPPVTFVCANNAWYQQ